MDLNQLLNQTLGLHVLSWAFIAVRTSVVYLVVILGLRLLGRREMSQMTIFDFVLLLTLSNAVQNAMTGPDTTLDGGIVSALTLLALDRLFSYLGLNSPLFRRTFEGQPVMLIHYGQFMRANMKHQGISEDELMQTLREHGLDAVDHVRSAILETDGSISIVPTDAPAPIHAKRRKPQQQGRNG